MALRPRNSKGLASGRGRSKGQHRTDRSPALPTRTEDAAGERGRGASFLIVGVGASAGGLEAFTQLLRALPLDTGMGFVLVQHLDPDHDSALAQILSRATSLPVLEITNDELVRANHVYIIPPDTDLSIAGGVLKIQPRERTRAPHRSIDVFFKSLAQDQRERAVGVVLSGTANDGTLGLEAIKAEGGITFAQDASARHDSMPRSAVATGCVDFVLSPTDIAKELARIAKHPSVAGHALLAPAEDDGASASTQEDEQAPRPSGEQGSSLTQAEQERAEAEGGRGERAESKVAQDGYKRILLLLRNHSRVDFSLYKSATIQRRITRRMVVNTQQTLEDYADFLLGNSKELDALYSDVLIGVTSFFRNPETFEFLEKKVLPELLMQRGDDPLRCWVLGCSTGQEAYSIAIAFLEAAENAPRVRKLQIFATDLNDAMLDKARHGLYPKSVVGDVTPQRLRRYFVEEAGGYRVNKTLRDMVVFARQNVIADPPFSRLDFISCRNLLIYLERSLQQKALPTFHYALKPGGFLLLGASESIGGFRHLFEPVDAKYKIYSKKSAPAQALRLPVGTEHGAQLPGPRSLASVQLASGLEPQEGSHVELDAQREADRITVTQFAPAGVLVNAAHQVLQFRGPTGAFLEPPIGKASFDVLKMAREGLMLPLRSAIEQARREVKSVRKENVRVQRNGTTRKVNLEVIPLRNLRELCFLILFEEAERVSGVPKPREPKSARADRSPGREASNRIVELETDLSETRGYVEALQEQIEAANEEFQTANEETQSANEELQSSNEELETSKEELESTNEDLTTVNEEMSNRNVELNRLNNDLVNLQISTKLAVVLLGRDLTVRRFSPQAEKQFELLAADTGRPIGHFRHNLVLGDAAGSPLDLEVLSTEVISDVREQEREVRDHAGRWHLLRVRPYMTLDNKVDGAVIVLMDIDLLKRSEQAMRESEARYRAMFESTIVGVSEADPETGRLLRVNEQFARIVGYTAAELVGTTFLDLIHPDDLPGHWDGYSRLVRGEFETFEIEKRLIWKDATIVWVYVTVHLVRDAAGRPLRTVAITLDITERKRLETELRQRGTELSEADRRKNEFLAMLGHELRNPPSAIVHGLDLLGDVQDDRARLEELHGMMVRQTKRIGQLLDQLLDIARVTSGKVELSKARIDLADVVRAAVETVRPLIESQKHELLLSLPSERSAYVLGDAVRLPQVVENLLTNAAKYTNEGGQIALTLESDDETARITIRDNGIGMSAELLPQIFEVFAQAPRTLERAKGGLGLGLHLAQRLVEMHGGHVSASSPGLGQGSEFVITLPRLLERRSNERLEGKPAPTIQSSKIRARRILVVDDEQDMAGAFAALLEADGHETLAVNDGPAALVAARTFAPEVVILDLGLPEMDGYEIAKRLREEHGDKKLLLIAVTGYQSDAARLKEAGFDQHLIKPPNPRKLSAVIAAWDNGGTGAP